MPETGGATTHAAERAAQRYGVTATKHDWKQAVLDIIGAVAGDRPAKAMLLGRDQRHTERWGVTICGRAMVAIYDPEAAAIITVIPWGRELGNRYAPGIQSKHQPRRRESSDRYGERFLEDV